MDNKIIPHLVARFLSWKLPPDFRPDAGISFAPEYNNGTPEGGRHEPSGTNLLSAEQAFAMFRHVLDHPAVTAIPERELLAEALEALQLIANCIHPRFREVGDIDLLYANEEAFGDCINIARAAADKIRAALTQEKQT